MAEQEVTNGILKALLAEQELTNKLLSQVRDVVSPAATVSISADQAVIDHAGGTVSISADQAVIDQINKASCHGLSRVPITIGAVAMSAYVGVYRKFAGEVVLELSGIDIVKSDA